MNKKINREKGVTLMTLSIVIIAISIFTITILLNVKQSTGVKKLTELNTDISNLTQKVSDFYNEYGEIPGDIEYTQIDGIDGILNSIEKSEGSKFFVIDLQAMKGISLNYGRDYENVKNTDTNTANQYKDLYIINNETHNIFYVQGVTVNQIGVEKTYYTDYDKASDVPSI